MRNDSGLKMKEIPLSINCLVPSDSRSLSEKSAATRAGVYRTTFFISFIKE